MILKSAGILLYRLTKTYIEFLLVHPGGPFFKNKDLGFWTIPKGEFADDENAIDAAIREFYEETGASLSGKLIELKPIKQKNNKLVYAWALEGELNEKEINSNFFEIEWPPKSGVIKQFPEIDKGEWYDYDLAIKKININQKSFIDEIIRKLNLQDDQIIKKDKNEDFSSSNESQLSLF